MTGSLLMVCGTTINTNSERSNFRTFFLETLHTYIPYKYSLLMFIFNSLVSQISRHTNLRTNEYLKNPNFLNRHLCLFISH